MSTGSTVNPYTIAFGSTPGTFADGGDLAALKTKEAADIAALQASLTALQQTVAGLTPTAGSGSTGSSGGTSTGSSGTSTGGSTTSSSVPMPATKLGLGGSQPDYTNEAGYNAKLAKLALLTGTAMSVGQAFVDYNLPFDGDFSKSDGSRTAPSTSSFANSAHGSSYGLAVSSLGNNNWLQIHFPFVSALVAYSNGNYAETAAEAFMNAVAASCLAKDTTSGSHYMSVLNFVEALHDNGNMNVVVRGGLEQNFFGYGWWATLDQAQCNAYVAMWQAVAPVMKAHAASLGMTLLMCWCPANINGTTIPTESTWPGPQYVDVIGHDIYSADYSYMVQGSGGPWLDIDSLQYVSKADWDANWHNRRLYWLAPNAKINNYTIGSNGKLTLGDAGWGLRYALYFARQQGKPFVICEMGAGRATTGDPNGPYDDPALFHVVATELRTHFQMGGLFHHATPWIFDESGGQGYPAGCDVGQRPGQTAALRRLADGINNASLGNYLSITESTLTGITAGVPFALGGGICNSTAKPSTIKAIWNGGAAQAATGTNITDLYPKTPATAPAWSWFGTFTAEVTPPNVAGSYTLQLVDDTGAVSYVLPGVVVGSASGSSGSSQAPASGAAAQIGYIGESGGPTGSWTLNNNSNGLAWNAPSSATTITEYVTQYRKTGASGWTSGPNAPNIFVQLTGLASSTEYDFQVAAVNSAGQGAWSNTYNFTTTAS